MVSPSSLVPPPQPGPSNFNTNRAVSVGGLSRSNKSASLSVLAAHAPSPSPPSRNASLSSSSWESGSRATSPTPPSSLTDSIDSDSSSGSRTTRLTRSRISNTGAGAGPPMTPSSSSKSPSFVVTSRPKEYQPPFASHQIPPTHPFFHADYSPSSSSAPSSPATPMNKHSAPASRIIPLPIQPSRLPDGYAASPAVRTASRSPSNSGHASEAKTTSHLQSSVNAKGQRMVNQYVRLKTIGRGSHGKVWLCAEPSTRASASEEEDNSSSRGSYDKRSFETNDDGAADPTYYCAIKSVARDGFGRHRSLREAKARKHGSDGVSGGIAGDDKIKREVAIMKRLDHRNIVKLKEVIDDPKSKKVFMVLEFMAGGEVEWQDEDKNPMMTVDEARRTFRDVVLGLEYLHYQGIIHRDIKPANLLWTEDHSTVKISDFGVSHVSDALVRASPGASEGDDSDLRKTAGSPAFFAPELCAPADAMPSPLEEVDEDDEYFSRDDLHRDLVHGGDDEAAVISTPIKISHRPSHRSRPVIGKGIDVWALGVTLYCLLFGDTPFTARTEYELYNVIVNEAVQVPSKMGREGMWTGYGDRPSDSVGDGVEGREVVDLLGRLLEKDPIKRITLAEVKRHPWVLRNLRDPGSWLSENDPSHVGSVKITEEDVEHATQQRGATDKFVKTRHRPSIRRALNAALVRFPLFLRGSPSAMATTTTTTASGTLTTHTSPRRSGTTRSTLSSASSARKTSR